MAPQGSGANEELLKHQPKTYKKHVPWLTKYKPAEVRFGLTVERGEGETKLEKFETALKAGRWQQREEEAAPSEAAEAEEPES